MYKNKTFCKLTLLAGLLCLAFLLPARVHAQGEFVKAAENESLALYYNPATLAIQVENKATGFVYSSMGQTPPGEGEMNNTWQGMMDSGVSIDIRQSNGSTKTWAISNQEVQLSTRTMENGFESDIAFPEGISLTLRVELTEQGLTVSVPEDSVRESGGDTTLQAIYLYPFLGATHGTENQGYLFVPDGSGALIHTSRQTLSTEPYEKQIYGSDISMGTFKGRTEASFLKEAERIYVPVFGSVMDEEKDGVAVIVHEGAEYCRIVAYASGIRTPYNFIMPKFLIRETYQMKVSQSGSSMTANQPRPNRYDIELRYSFLSGEEADYVGIAKVYQQYLRKEGVLTGTEETGDGVPMKLEFLLSEQREELLWSATVPMTTEKQAETVVQELYDQGIRNLDVVLRGYGKNGATGAAPTKLSFAGKVGSKGDWKDFLRKFGALGLDVSLYADFSRGYEGIGGYGNAQRAQAIDQTLLQTYDYAPFTWLSPTFAVKELEKFAKEAAGLDFAGVAADVFGSSLYANWNKKDPLTRKEARELYQGADTGEMKLSLYAPSAFLFGRADAIYDMPASSSDYYIFTETVPFLQIVLKGYLPYYSGAWNFQADVGQELLRCVDYGMYPNWYVTWEDPIELINTPSSWLYSSQYEVWKDSILSRYQRLNEALEGVVGCQILDRTVLAKDVVRVDYSNGTSIYVNYGTAAWEGSGSGQGESVSVDGESFLVMKGGAS